MGPISNENAQLPFAGGPPRSDTCLVFARYPLKWNRPTREYSSG